MGKLKLNNAKELIQRNVNAGVKWVEQAYNRCYTDADIIRLAGQIAELDKKNQAKYKSFTSTTNIK